MKGEFRSWVSGLGPVEWAFGDSVIRGHISMSTLFQVLGVWGRAQHVIWALARRLRLLGLHEWCC